MRLGRQQVRWTSSSSWSLRSFPDQPAGNRHFWLLVEGGDAQVCYTDPGDEPALWVRSESRAFIDWHRGRLSWSQARRSHRIEVTGRRDLAAALPSWNLRRPRMPAAS